MIDLNAAATSARKPKEVAKAVYDALLYLGNSGRGNDAMSLDTAMMIYQTRKKLANLFDVKKPANVVFTANATQSLNMAICGLLQKGDHVITTCMEHNSVLRPLYQKEKEGVEISFVGCDAKGVLQYEQFPLLLQKNTKMVVCTHGSNVTGNLNDIAKIGAFCKQNGLLFVVDASQTAGVFPISMQKMHIDVLCFTGHKGLMGPQGTGGLCVAECVEIPSFYTGGTGVQSFSKTQPQTYPEHLEAGTLNGHGIAGLSAALDFIEKTGLETIQQKEHTHMMQFYDGIKGIPKMEIYGDFETKQRAAIVTCNIKGVSSDKFCDVLAQEYDIAVRGGVHCAPLLHEALGTAKQGAVRFSFGYFVTEAEVETAITAVKQIVEALT